MKKKTHSLLAVLFTLTAAGASAGNFQPDSVPADARWVAYADLDTLRETRMGTWLMGKIEADPAAKGKLDAFAALFRFDLVRDLSSITLFGRGDGNPEDGVVLVRGRFEPEHLVTLLKANPDYAEIPYGAHRIHRWIDEGKKMNAEKKKMQPPATYGCFHGRDFVVIGNRETDVRQALDVLDGKAPGHQADAQALLPGAFRAAAFAQAAADLAAMRQIAPKAEVFKRARSMTAALGEADGKLQLAMGMEADTAETASEIKKIVDGMIALVLLGAEDNPGAAALARAVDTAMDGAKVSMSLSYPVDEAIRLMEEEEQKKKGGAR